MKRNHKNKAKFVVSICFLFVSNALLSDIYKIISYHIFFLWYDYDSVSYAMIYEKKRKLLEPHKKSDLIAALRIPAFF